MRDGGTIPNLGQSQLNLSDESIHRDIQSVFQIAAVMRPLMSVGRICDEGHSITFNAIMAVVHGKDVCRFQKPRGFPRAGIGNWSFGRTCCKTTKQLI